MNEDKNFKKRNIIVFVFELLLILVAVGGLTFAATEMFGGSRTIISFGDYNVDYVGETEIVANNLEPISDSLVNYDTTDDVIRLEFSLRGVDTNQDAEKLIYDVMIKDINIDCSLLNEYTKWNLYKNGELLSTGNFSPSFDGNVLTNNFRLTETQQSLPLSTDNYDKYVLIIWISEACDDLSSCERVDQSGILNSVIDMNVFIALFGGDKVEYKRVPNDNYTCVNKPELYDGMIPVFYNEGEWKIADSTNSDVNSIWYNYGESMWANAVFVNTDKYKEADSGTIVNQEDILGYYVWVPRFKYMLWNNGHDSLDSYDAYHKGINVVFESGVNSSGKAKCTDKLCDTSKDKYLTHPAFSDNLRGFWISKYEISADSKFIPNVESLRNDNLDNYKNLINNLSTTYGIVDSVDSHIITNLEWGATLYLSHSKYGVCHDGSCEMISSNDTYISEKNKQDTTTRDVYGVYDMAGGTSEYALGNDNFGSATYEVITSSGNTWYNGIYTNNSEYLIRGGIKNGLFSTVSMDMIDVSTRSVLISKEKDLVS